MAVQFINNNVIAESPKGAWDKSLNSVGAPSPRNFSRDDKEREMIEITKNPMDARDAAVPNREEFDAFSREVEIVKAWAAANGLASIDKAPAAPVPAPAALDAPVAPGNPAAPAIHERPVGCACVIL
jgi:hypothetical protein